MDILFGQIKKARPAINVYINVMEFLLSIVFGCNYLNLIFRNTLFISGFILFSFIIPIDGLCSDKNILSDYVIIYDSEKDDVYSYAFQKKN